MNPKRVRTLHDGVEIPAVEPERARDPYRAMRVWTWIVLFGAPLFTLGLMNDFLWLPNGYDNRYSSAAAWRDSVILGRPNRIRGGAHTTSLGVTWLNHHVVAWEDADGWHAVEAGERAFQEHYSNGRPVIPWQQGGDVMLWMPRPGTRVGLWGMSWRIEPYVQAMDPVTAMLSTASLPPQANAEIRAALVRVGGERAGKEFDGAGGFAGFTLARRLEPLGLVHNLLALAMFAGMVVGWGLWPTTYRRYRRYRRGLCFLCAYPLGGVRLPVCPECGGRFARSARYPGGSPR